MFTPFDVDTKLAW